MARPLGSGPIHVWLAFGPPATPVVSAPGFPTAKGPGDALYYGTTREGPDITEELAYYPVMNDLTGPKQSLDEGFAGREDNISLVMTSWNQAVDNMLENIMRPNNGGDASNATTTRGTDALSDLGTLMVSEGLTIGLWLVKAAALKAVNVAAGMPRGRYYMTTIPMGPNKPIEGNKENMRVRVFRAKKNPWGMNAGSLPLFREDDAAFTGLGVASFG